MNLLSNEYKLYDIYQHISPITLNVELKNNDTIFAPQNLIFRIALFAGKKNMNRYSTNNSTEPFINMFQYILKISKEEDKDP